MNRVAMQVAILYAELAVTTNQFPHRHTPQGQALLSAMRDYLALCGNIDAETVQNMV